MTLAIKSLDLFELICDYPYINDDVFKYNDILLCRQEIFAS